MARFVWQSEDWAESLHWNADRLLPLLGGARRVQGDLLGRASQLGLESGGELRTTALADEALTTSAIEGVFLDPAGVRSSVARRLGVPHAGIWRPDRRTEGLLDVLLDATAGFDAALTAERLCRWQAALFPTGHSRLREIEVGRWRTAPEPMQVVSGPMGREHVHFEAPPADRLEAEMRSFLDWWGGESRSLDGLLRAGVAHLVFVTIHPFDDGNGRVARAICDMALAQDERSGVRLYSLSRGIADEREAYYAALERAQRGTGDITDWLAWFLGCLERGITRSVADVERVLAKSRFWTRHGGVALSERQRKVLNRMLDAGPGGFEGGITTRKYVGLTSTSRATAQRELADLVAWGMLAPRPGGGRSTSYDVAW